MEPALTNIGIVLPDEGYLEAVRDVTRRTGTLLVVDETHTLCARARRRTRAWHLDPDMLVVGKPIGGVSRRGVRGQPELADRLEPQMRGHEIDVAGVGGTLDRQRASRWPRSARRSPRPCARRTSRWRCRWPRRGRTASPA